MTQRTGHDVDTVRSESTVPGARGLRLVTLTMAFACGLAVANLYYAQPLLALIARSFDVSQGAATVVVTATQLGYAIGLVVLLPLGDLINNRKLTSRTMVAPPSHSRSPPSRRPSRCSWSCPCWSASRPWSRRSSSRSRRTSRRTPSGDASSGR